MCIYAYIYIYIERFGNSAAQRTPTNKHDQADLKKWSTKGPNWGLGGFWAPYTSFPPPYTSPYTSLGQAFHFGNNCTSLEAPARAAAAWRLRPVQVIQSRVSLHCGQRCSRAQLRLHALPVHCNCGQYPPHIRRLEITVVAVVPLTQGSLTCACFSKLLLEHVACWLLSSI